MIFFWLRMVTLLVCEEEPQSCKILFIVHTFFSNQWPESNALGLPGVYSVHFWRHSWHLCNHGHAVLLLEHGKQIHGTFEAQSITPVSVGTWFIQQCCLSRLSFWNVVCLHHPQDTQNHLVCLQWVISSIKTWVWGCTFLYVYSSHPFPCKVELWKTGGKNQLSPLHLCIKSFWDM